MMDLFRADCRSLAVIMLVLCACGPVFAADSQADASSGTAKSPAASAVIASAFSDTDSGKIIAVLVSGAAKQTVSADRKAILECLADFEERIGLPVQAAKHYAEASYADPSARDYELLLDASRAALISNDTEQANGLVRAVLVSCFDDSTLLRARVYAVWVQLASGDRGEALSQIRSCANNPVFADYIPKLLFTLWWADSDASAKKRLLDQYPQTLESRVARGELSLSPGPFWFLMGRNPAGVAAFASAGSGSMPASPPVSVAAAPPKDSVAQSSPLPSLQDTPVAGSSDSASAGKVWQQVGFFKSRDNADDLVARLKKAGFSPIVRSERRASGTVYFSVIVPEDDDRAAGARLKDAGFESCLVFD